MFRSIIIGNLGSDAEVKNENGSKFVSFSVGHNDRWTDKDGNVKESTQWVSCALNGDGGKLLPYLKAGKLVYVEGRTTTRVFSSEKLRRMVAGVNISVDHIELLGGNTDDVPRRLSTKDGVLLPVYKAYYIAENEAKAILGREKTSTLFSTNGQQYLLQKGGWVTPNKDEKPVDNNNEETKDNAGSQTQSNT